MARISDGWPPWAMWLRERREGAGAMEFGKGDILYAFILHTGQLPPLAGAYGVESIFYA